MRTQCRRYYLSLGVLSSVVQHCDDLAVSEEHAFGPWTVMKKAAMEFTGQQDPQTMHIDESAAEASISGRLIASGRHTASTMRLLVNELLTHCI